MQGRPFEARGPSDCACDCRGVNREGAERARSRAGGAYPDCDSPRPSGRERECVPRRLRLSRDLKSVMLKNVPRGGRAPARGVRGPNADRAAASAMTRLIQCVRSMNIAHRQGGAAPLRAGARGWTILRSRKCVRMLNKGTQHQFYSLINAHCQRARAGCSSKP